MLHKYIVVSSKNLSNDCSPCTPAWLFALQPLMLLPCGNMSVRAIGGESNASDKAFTMKAQKVDHTWGCSA